MLLEVFLPNYRAFIVIGTDTVNINGIGKVIHQISVRTDIIAVNGTPVVIKHYVEQGSKVDTNTSVLVTENVRIDVGSSIWKNFIISKAEVLSNINKGKPIGSTNDLFFS